MLLSFKKFLPYSPILSIISDLLKGLVMASKLWSVGWEISDPLESTNCLPLLKIMISCEFVAYDPFLKFKIPGWEK